MKDKNGKKIKVGDLLDPFYPDTTWPYSYRYRVLSISADNKSLMARNSEGVNLLTDETCSKMAVCGRIRPIDDNLTKYNIQEYDLDGADLSGRELAHFNFSGLKLDRVNFRYARLYECKFNDSIIEHCDFKLTIIHDTDFRDAVIADTEFDDSLLLNAYFSNSMLSRTDFYATRIEASHFSKCTIEGCLFRFAILPNTKFTKSNISNTDLTGASMPNTKIKDTKMDFILASPETSGYYLACPEEGAFIGWKKCMNNDIVKLLITEDAKRSSATSRKCRCSKAKVLLIESNGERRPSYYITRSIMDSSFTYKVGEIVEVPDFDEDRWHECAPGIHFFLTKQEAIDYDI